MLLLTTVGSLTLWIVIPWLALGWSPTLVTSGSMTPVVTPGDVVMIRPASVEEFGSGTVVLYDRSDTGPVLHRVVTQLPDGTFQTRGDANASPDSTPVRSSDVQGVAVLRVPWVGRASLWLYQGRTGPLVVTGVLALTMVVLAPRAFDPAYDPWANTRRVKPAQVLLGHGSGSRARRADSGSHLLPRPVHDRVLERLAAQSADAQSRTAQLLEGVS